MGVVTMKSQAKLVQIFQSYLSCDSGDPLHHSCHYCGAPVDSSTGDCCAGCGGVIACGDLHRAVCGAAHGRSTSAQLMGSGWHALQILALTHSISDSGTDSVSLTH